MPIPLIPVLVGAAAGAVGGGAVGIVSSTYVTPWFTPAQRRSSYRANYSDPNLLPPLEGTIAAYWRNQVSENDLVAVAANYGAQVGALASAHPENLWLHRAWSGILNSHQPVQNMDILLTAEALQTINQQELNKQVSLNGFVKQEYYEAWRARKFLPGYDQALEQFRLGTITRQEFDAIRKRIGMTRADDSTFFDKYSAPLQVAVTVDLYNRGLLTWENAKPYIAANGFVDGETVDSIFQLANAQVTPNAEYLANAVQLGVADPTVYQPMGLYSDMPEWYRKYATLSGAGNQIAEIPTLSGGNVAVSWAEITWAASRNRLRADQAVTLHQRLRPETVEKFREVGLSVSAFDQTMLNAALGQNGYPSGLRDYVAALSYKPPSLIHIRQGIFYGLITDERALELMRDAGFLPKDAQLYISIAKARKSKADAKHIDSAVDKATNRGIDTTIQMYQDGSLTRDHANALLSGFGFTTEQALQVLDAQELQWQKRSFDESIKAIRSSYMQGAISPAQVVPGLIGAGVTPERAASYLQRWQLARTVPRRIASVGKTLDWLERGMITQEDATFRLANLGYSNPDILLFISEAQRKGVELQGKAMSAAARGRAQQSAQLQKIRDDSIKHQRAIEQQIRRVTPVGKLQRWIRDGIVTDDYAFKRLVAGGYDDATAKLYIADAHKTSNGQSKTKKQPAPGSQAAPG